MSDDSDLILTGIVQTTFPPATSGTRVAPATASANRLFDFLDIVNGTDAYDSTSIAVGKLDPSKYLHVPHGVGTTAFNPDCVGTKAGNPNLTNEQFVQIYALNKKVFGNDERAIKIALIRAHAVKLGWLTSSYEVKYVSEDPDAETIMNADFDIVTRHSDTARTLAALLPLAAEFVFRTMGHHYLTGMGPDYDLKYQKFFNACVQSGLTSFLAPADLYHNALHWVSLKDALAVAQSKLAARWLPNAVVIRAKAAPAGTAIISTSTAILAAMEGTGLKDAIVKHSGINIALIDEVTAQVASSPDRYHTIPHAYSSRGLGDDEKIQFAEAKAEAIKLAPVLQGFLDALPNSASLAQAKALAKHADSNPLLRKRAKVFFREVGIAKAANIEELFLGNKRGKEAEKSDEVDEDE